eukprot:TRINITY_DN1568_c0_g1_i1.p1 TRINITY_DN1568_c0_g1~~TRINITY_DN1568_c0_g1_i1.p1  ORF type:complete len:285 (-),score=12.54 TRINITY_DN1568_c0_g1_i1:77-931(-)
MSCFYSIVITVTLDIVRIPLLMLDRLIPYCWYIHGTVTFWYLFTRCYPLALQGGYWWIIISGVLYIITIISFLRTSFSDPGIIPINVIEPDDAPKSTKEHIIILDNMVTLTYCYTCQIWRPFRTHHCKLCDACIDMFDHHCIWVGNCIGKLNYRKFILFLIATTLYLIHTMFTCIYNIDWKNKLIDIFVSHKIEVILIVYTFIVFCFMINLIRYHLMLIKNDLTTYECEKKLFENGDRIKKGCAATCKSRLCKNYSSHIDFQEVVPPEEMEHIIFDYSEKDRLL